MKRHVEFPFLNMGKICNVHGMYIKKKKKKGMMKIQEGQRKTESVGFLRIIKGLMFIAQAKEWAFLTHGERLHPHL